MEGVKVVSGPATEPVTLTEAKARLRVTVSDEDTLITDLIAECRAACEAECGRAFITQTLRLYLDSFPKCGAPIRLPFPPLQSVTSVTYYDVDGVLQTLSTEDYHVAANGEPGRIVPVYGVSWPVTEAGRPESVIVEFVAGYGAASAVPRDAKAAILALVADWHTNPDGGDRPIPPAVRRRLDALEYGEVR